MLGFRSPAGYLSTADANTLTRSAHEQFVSKEPPSTERNSIDFSNTGAFRLTLSYKKKHKSRNERASVTDASFFQPEVDPALPSDTAQAKLDCPAMTKALEVPQERASRRKLARMEAQEGPWSVSVADTPYDKNSYSIYIKSEYSTSHLTILPPSFPIKLFSRRWICFTSISLCFAIREAVSLLSIRFVHKFVHRCASFAHLHLLLFPCSTP